MSRFLALGLPREVVDVLAGRAEESRRSATASARWVRPERYHVTVAFLRKDASLDVAAETAQQLASEAPHLVLGGYGRFATQRAAAVLWLAIHDPTAGLARLTASAHAALTGELPAERPFARSSVAHVTLARSQDAVAFDAILAAREPAPLGFRPTALLVVDTIGDQYRVAHEAPFA